MNSNKYIKKKNHDFTASRHPPLGMCVCERGGGGNSTLHLDNMGYGRTVDARASLWVCKHGTTSKPGTPLYLWES